MLREALSSRRGLWRGLSDAGLGRVLETVREAGQVDASVLLGNGSDVFTGERLRTRCRWVLALLPEGADLVGAAAFVFANPNMVGEWHRVVGPSKSEYSMEVLRAASGGLLAGRPVAEVAGETGLPVSYVALMASFFGSLKAHSDALWKDALVFAEEELTFELLRAQWGLLLSEAREHVPVWFPEPLSDAGVALRDGTSVVWRLAERYGLSRQQCGAVMTQARRVVREVAA